MKSLLLTFFVCISMGALAQQDPLYAQYFNNPLLINPAYAGSTNRLYAGIAYRSQWSGLVGAPSTFSFNGHTSLVDNKIGVGLIVSQDKIGETKNLQVGSAFAYKIQLKNNTSFSFGMQVGFYQYSTSQDGLNVLNPDPLFTPITETRFNTGVGLLLKGDRFVVGLSVPQLLSSSGTVNQGNLSANLTIYSQNYYLFGSYAFPINEQIEFKPSTLLRYTGGSSPSVDLNANFTFKKMYTAGVLTRNFHTMGFLVQGVYRNFRLGYMFEIPGKGTALNYNTGELSLAMTLPILPEHDRSSNGF